MKIVKSGEIFMTWQFSCQDNSVVLSKDCSFEPNLKCNFQNICQWCFIFLFISKTQNKLLSCFKCNPGDLIVPVKILFITIETNVLSIQGNFIDIG